MPKKYLETLSDVPLEGKIILNWELHYIKKYTLQINYFKL